MPKRKRFSRGMRKYIRIQKSRIRREIHNIDQQKRLIDELINRLGKK